LRGIAEANEDLLDEAEVEHASAKDLIAQIRSSDASDPLCNAKVKVLGEYIDHHVKEEQDELFPKDVEDAGWRSSGDNSPSRA